MSSGDGFWDKFTDGGAWAPGFGVYSTSTSNQNKRNKGYNNSLNTGGNYSTTLGVNFSTVVGCNFSTTGLISMSTVVGANLPNTEGGKVELIIPWSVKWTRGLYDYDFKSCSTQLKKNAGGNVITANAPAVVEMKLTPQGERRVVNKQEDFNTQANLWVATKTYVVREDVQKVLDGDLQYVRLSTKVAGNDTKEIGGGHSVTASVLKLTSTQKGTVMVAANVSIHGGTLRFNGSKVLIG